LLIQVPKGRTQHKLVWEFFFSALFIYVAFSGFGHCPLLALVFFLSVPKLDRRRVLMARQIAPWA
jgi:hypothetical protein